jgi:hypothetical protein
LEESYDMEWQKFVEYVFYGLMGGVAVYVAHSIDEMRKSIEKLNIHMAGVTEKGIQNEKENMEIKRRLERLERIRRSQ